MLSSSFKLPQQLLDYYTDLSQELGIGGFAKVILARHNETDVKVAIKIIYKDQIRNELYRIKDEIAVLKKLNHQNICKVYQVYETDTHAFMVLEYLSGGELYDQIVHNKKMTEKEARRIFRQVLSAVGYIHSCGIAHRDLKPENILIDDLKNIRIIDFGLSANPSGGLIDPLQTLCGSIAYAAPELLSGKPYLGSEVDVWSMGVLLFTLLCGYLPFDNNNNIQTALNNIKKGIYKFPSGVSKDAKNVIACMLEPEPKKRHTVWNLANHEWVKRGYGSSISWGACSNTVNIDENFVNLLCSRYTKTYDVVVTMINERALNEITAHYDFLKHKHSYNGLNMATAYASYLSDNSKENIKESFKNQQKSLPKPCIPIQTIYENINENDESICQCNVKKRKAVENIDESTNKIANSCNANTSIITENHGESNIRTKIKLIDKITELFTPKRHINQISTPRLMKPAANIRVVSQCEDKKLQSVFDSTLLDLKNMGNLLAVKFENYIYKCEKACEKKQKLVFTLEICKVPSAKGIETGILTKRIKGDSWEYKRAVEEIVDIITTKYDIKL